MKNAITILVNAETAKAVHDLEEFFAKSREGIKVLAELAGIGLGLHAMESLVHQVLDLGSALKNLKAQVGGSIPDLMVLRRQLAENGASAQEAGQMLTFMQRAIVTAAEEGGSGAQLFTDLHLSVSLSQLSAMTATEQYKLLGQAIAAIENPAKRTEAVLKVFGRGSAELAAVFSDPKKFEAAFQGANVFGNVMARNAELFHEMETSMARFANNGKKLMAGILDQLAPQFEHFFEELGRVDLTRAGQRIGAFIQLVISSWKDGKLDEVIGLTIQAGFEASQKGFEFLKTQLGKVLGSESAKLLGSTFAMTFSKELILGFLEAERLLAEAFINLAGIMAKAIDSALVTSLNKVINWINGNPVFSRLSSSSIQNVSLSDNDSQVQEEVRQLNAGFEMLKAPLTSIFDKGIATARALWGTDGAAMPAETALKRLAALLDAVEAKRAKAVVTEKAEAMVPIQNRLGALREIERTEKERILELDRQLSKIETDFAMTAVEKFVRKTALLEQQRDAYLAISRALKELAKAQDDAGAKETLNRSLEFEAGANRKQHEIDAQGPDPRSFSEQWKNTMREIQDAWGTWAKQITATFKSVFESAVSSVSAGISGLILGTKTWGQALREIGTSIVTNIVQAFVQMGVQWIATHALMGGVSALFRSQETVQEGAHIASRTAMHVTGEASKTAATGFGAAARGALRLGETLFHGLMVAYRTAAHIAGEVANTAASVIGTGIRIALIIAESLKWVLQAAIKAAVAVASIPYVGPILAIAAMGAVAAAGYALVNGGFEEGGFTGTGGRQEVAGVVHRGEFVFSAPAVERIGVGNLEAMHSGGSSRTREAGPSGVQNTISIGVINDRSDIPKWARSQSGERHILDLVRRNWHTVQR